MTKRRFDILLGGALILLLAMGCSESGGGAEDNPETEAGAEGDADAGGEFVDEDATDPGPDTSEPDVTEDPDTPEPGDAEGEDPEPACTGDVECDDGNPCTDDLCDAATGCVNTPNSGPCDDGAVCTVNDTCVDGTCVGEATDCESTDCLSAECEPGIGCVLTPVEGPCDDGDACTEGDACFDGVCTSGAAAACDDGNPCTVDDCDPDFGCSSEAVDSGPCDDGDPCTEGDACVAGSCVSGPLTDCGDANPCTVDACVEGVGCTYGFTLDACDDGDACTGGDACAAGDCVPGGAVTCDDGNACTSDTCDPAAGCVFAPVSGAACDDGDACSTDSFCEEGACVGAAFVVCDDGEACTTDSCVEGDCEFTFTTGPCNDGDACTESESCATGLCTGGVGVDCDDGNPCTADTCDAALGCVHTAADGDCDDGDFCTLVDQCNGGVCVGLGGLNCNDGDVCTDDTCDPEDGCQWALNTADCEDGDLCTAGDSCVEGVCVGGAAPPCDDGNECTTDSCDPVSGCGHAGQTGTPCNDGDPCTLFDACANGECIFGAVDHCDDGDPCTDDGCEPGEGCGHAPNSGAPCDDGSDCTFADSCSDGACGGETINCGDDGNDCTAAACVDGVGCVFEPVEGPCDDGDVCTTGDTCDSGVCVSSGEVACDDGDACTVDSCDPVLGCTTSVAPDLCDDVNPCTDDACDPATGCTYVVLEGACDDGDACTGDDVCTAGQCVGQVDVDCDDGNQCTDDFCDVTDGCVHLDVVGGCDDGDPCTSGETCEAAACTAPAGAPCDDGLDCTADSCEAGVGCAHVVVAGSCAVDGACYGDGDDSPFSGCLVCDAAAASDTWTELDTPLCKLEAQCGFNNGLDIEAVVAMPGTCGSRPSALPFELPASGVVAGSSYPLVAAPVGPPSVLTDGSLLVATEDGALSCVGGPVTWSLPIGEDLTPPILAADGAVFTVTASGGILNVDRANGEVQWQLLAGANVTSWPVRFGDRLYVADQNGLVRSYNSAGVMTWIVSVGAGVELPLAVGPDGGLRVVTATHDLFIFGESDFLVGTADLGEPASWVAVSADGSTIVSTVGDGGVGGSVRAYETDGTLRWTAAVSQPIHGFAVDSTHVVVADATGQLFRIEHTGGNAGQLGAPVDLGAAPSAGPVVDAVGTVYVPLADGTIAVVDAGGTVQPIAIGAPVVAAPVGIGPGSFVAPTASALTVFDAE